MLKSKFPINNEFHHPGKPQNNKGRLNQSKRLALMCKVAAGIINQLYNPIDATNRFINLALQSIDDNAHSRQFLIESKQGIRKTSSLLKKLANYTRRIEKEIRQLSTDNE